jgi:hypothetical protein
MFTPLVPPELLDPVVAYFQPRRVILFGSAARGEAGPDSDIDLLVVLDDDAPKEKLSYRAGMEARRPGGRDSLSRGHLPAVQQDRRHPALRSPH